MEEKKVILEVLRGPDSGKTYMVEGDHVVVGRSKQCDIILTDESISRQHLDIRVDSEQRNSFKINDLGSRNGVYLNEKRITSSTVFSGEPIQIGETVFSLQYRSEESLDNFRFQQTDISVEGEETADTLIASLEIEKVKPFDYHLKKFDQENIEKRLEAIYKLGEIMTYPSELQEKLDTILLLVFNTIPADSGAIFLQDPVSGNLEPVSIRHSDFSIDTKKVKVSWTIIRKAINERIGLIASDALEDPRFDGAESVNIERFRSVLAVPIFFHERLWGIFFLNTSLQKGIFSQEDLEFLTDIANKTAILIEHEHLMKTHISREKMAEIGELVSGLSHYIKNILFAFGASQTLIDSALDDKDLSTVSSVWPVLKSNIALITDLVHDMLYFSKKRAPKRRVVHIHDIIEEILSLYSPIASEKRFEIVREFGENVPSSLIDPQSFHRVILNLMKNAFDAQKSNESNRIVIKTNYNEDSDGIVIKIADNGVGIPPQNVDRIFHYLFSTKGNEGTGIGLFITRKIVEDHGGKITVESVVDEGTTFTIFLPIHRLTAPDKEELFLDEYYPET